MALSVVVVEEDTITSAPCYLISCVSWDTGDTPGVPKMWVSKDQWEGQADSPHLLSARNTTVISYTVHSLTASSHGRLWVASGGSLWLVVGYG